MRATRVVALAVTACLLSSCATLQSAGPVTCGVIGSIIGGAGGGVAGWAAGDNKVGPTILGSVLGWAGGAVAGYYLCRKPKPPPKQVAQATPAPAPAAPAKPDPCKEKVSLPAVNFDFAKAVIRPEGEKVLGEWESRLEQCTDVHVAINGHTDSIGSAAYNLKLSQRRADAVKDFLVNKGVSAARLTTKGFGMADPVASNSTPEGRAQNRRVDLVPST